MSKPKFTTSKSGSKAYFDSLNEYMVNNVLDSKNKFICEHWEKCEKSCDADGRKFYPGQLHHVGPLYDLKRNGKPFRILISGAEYGHESGFVPVGERTSLISDLDPSNPHMNGTLCLLQLLFGRDPDNDMLELEINGKQERILKAFSLANSLLCSGIKDGSSYGAFTAHMHKYCRDHYQKMLEILRPQMIILQGDRSWPFFWERYDIYLNHQEAKIEKIEVCGNPVLVLPLTHPSYQRKAWGGAGYSATKSYLAPAVEKLLGEYDNLFA